MQKLLISVFLSVVLVSSLSCQTTENSKIITGAEQTELYFPYLQDKDVAIVANHTSLVGSTHLLDTLLSANIKVKKIFSPEHGFRGKGDPGEYIENFTDKKSGLPVISLYGKNRKPDINDLKDIDIVVFDIQDVGVRFYTYITTMHYVMEACAESNTEMMILDRPNPNGFYIDGPVLDTQYRSFVGMHPIPLVHGMTIAELAKMINGEGWLKNEMICELNIISCENYTHDSLYQLPVKPSPNLPNMQSIYLYPSLGLFEGTIINVGRGTDFPFQVYGHPAFEGGNIDYRPRAIEGASSNPKHRGKLCHGVDLRKYNSEILIMEPGIRIDWLKHAMKNISGQEVFFKSFFRRLAGTDSLRKALERGDSVKEIKQGWETSLEEFQKKRVKYLLYEDFK
jgi:uncharacterized protein YbbC (DUF1343 family)